MFPEGPISGMARAYQLECGNLIPTWVRYQPDSTMGPDFVLIMSGERRAGQFRKGWQFSSMPDLGHWTGASLQLLLPSRPMAWPFPGFQGSEISAVNPIAWGPFRGVCSLFLAPIKSLPGTHYRNMSSRLEQVTEMGSDGREWWVTAPWTLPR